MTRLKKTFSTLLALLAVFFLVSSFQTSVAFEQKVIQSNGLHFWTESFGNQKNPAILLIMGSGGQGLMWPQAFCEQLAKKGFFVIRYDHRDTGLSSYIDYEKNPYTLKDMAKDAATILDGYHIQKSHIVGASMGGAIAMIFGGNYPDRTQSISLIATSPDIRATFDAFESKPSQSTLSKPADKILTAIKNVQPPQSFDELVQFHFNNIKLNSGSIPIDEKLVHELVVQSIVRTNNPENANHHAIACRTGYEIQQSAIKNIQAPTVIIHGDEDPIFGMDHAEAAHKAIPTSKLVVIPGLGHGMWNEQFYKPFIDQIAAVSKKQKSAT